MEITTEKILREEIKDLTAELDEAKSELEHALEKWRIAQGTAIERKKKIEKLEKKLEEVDVDFIRVVHAREVEKLQGRIDHLESVYWKHWREREELKQLCRDLYREAWMVSSDDPFYAPYRETGFKPKFKERMEQLGLPDGESDG